ncbi:VWA domain-containing protein [Candidatus Woesearchaeota archaeon]|nr:VWA domain-containing protein [Candidatus Woesearchaeota archaeon]
MLEKILQKIPFRRTLLTTSLLLGLHGCGDNIGANDNNRINVSGDTGSSINGWVYSKPDSSTPKADNYSVDQQDSTVEESSKDTENEIDCSTYLNSETDKDKDGYIDTGSQAYKNWAKACQIPSNPPLNDCDDDNPYRNPAAAEICNDVDDNCDCEEDTNKDGILCDPGDDGVNEGLIHSQWYKDNDGDGFGDPNGKKLFCTHPDNGYVQNPNDTDDTSPNVNPNIPEICDGIDNNSDGTIDEKCACINGKTEPCGTSNVGECSYGVQKCLEGTWGECKGAINPTKEECDGLDNNCDGQTDENLTQDCSNLCEENGFETCLNGIYVNCTAPQLEPEICNGKDDDCDGATDEGFTKYILYKDSDNDGFGCPSDILKEQCEQLMEGYVTNGDDCDCDNPDINPNAVEICDNIDNNCDGNNNELLGLTKYYKDSDGDGFGCSDESDFYCQQPEGYVAISDDCNCDNPNVNPNMEEICNGVDDDCDGLTDIVIDKTKCTNLGYDIVFVIDKSGSMEGSIGYVYNGLESVIQVWNQKDRGIMIAFDHEFYPFNQYSFTSDKVELEEYLDGVKALGVGGGTEIGKAVLAAIGQFQDNERQRAIVLFTDGQSSDAPELLNEKANNNNIEICALGFGFANPNYLGILTAGVGEYLHIGSDYPQIKEWFTKAYISLDCDGWSECSDGKFVAKSGKCGKAD